MIDQISRQPMETSRAEPSCCTQAARYPARVQGAAGTQLCEPRLGDGLRQRLGSRAW